jgi:hypothetical protein
MFRFKSNTGDKLSNIALFKDKLDALKNKIQEIHSFESGINFSQSPNAFDLVLSSDFKSVTDLEKYQIHPDHQDILGMVKKMVEEVHVVDYYY